MRREVKFFLWHAKRPKVVLIGLAHIGHRREARVEAAQDKSLQPRGLVSDQVRITSENQWGGRTPDQTQMGAVGVAEEQHGVGLPGAQALRQVRVVQPAEMVRARITGDIGHEFMVVP